MSFLFSFVHAPVCANCKIISCKLYTYSKKKKNKKQKMTCTSVWVKIPKLCHKMPRYLSFSLGKGRESLRLKPYEKLSLQVHFLTCSPACTKLDKASTMHLKIAQNVYFSREFCTFPVTEGNEIQHLYSFATPTRKLTHNTNFANSKIIRHFRPENPQNWTQKDMNFGNTKIIRHFRPENPQNPT